MFEMNELTDFEIDKYIGSPLVEQQLPEKSLYKCVKDSAVSNHSNPVNMKRSSSSPVLGRQNYSAPGASTSVRADQSSPNQLAERSDAKTQNILAAWRDYELKFWSHGRMSRAETDSILSSQPIGTFLIRESSSSAFKQLVLSIAQPSHAIGPPHVLHYLIAHNENGYRLKLGFNPAAGHQAFYRDSLAQLLQHDSNLFSSHLNRPILPPNSQSWLLGDEIPMVDMQALALIGQGQFSEVRLGVYKQQPAAFKFCHANNFNETDIVVEALILEQMQHSNIVSLIGTTRVGPGVFCLVLEHCAAGNLRHLLTNGPVHCNLAQLHTVAAQLAIALIYLKKKRILHRDLACRNCLISFEPNCGPDSLVPVTLKLGDFGLARFAPTGTIFGSASENIPVKWSAPETLSFCISSFSSEMWSFGVVLWEIFTLCQVDPYSGLKTAQDLIAALSGNSRLMMPVNCPSELYELMRKCWNWNPSYRIDITSALHMLCISYASVSGNSLAQVLEIDVSLLSEEAIGPPLGGAGAGDAAMLNGQENQVKAEDAAKWDLCSSGSDARRQTEEQMRRQEFQIEQLRNDKAEKNKQMAERDSKIDGLTEKLRCAEQKLQELNKREVALLEQSCVEKRRAGELSQELEEARAELAQVSSSAKVKEQKLCDEIKA